MKNVIAIMALLSVAVTGWSQGNVVFANLVFSGTARPLDAPFFEYPGGPALSGPRFQVQLWGRAEGSSSPYQAIGASVGFATGVGAGYWNPVTRIVPGVPVSSRAELIARVWDTEVGTTWEDAHAAGTGYGSSA